MRVYLISTVTLYREGLAEVLGRRDGVEVVGTSAELSAVRLTATAAHGGERTIVVLDVARHDAAEIAPHVARVAGAPVLAINVPARERDVIACAEAGVACCVTPEASIDDLVGAVTSVGRGEAPCSPWTAAVLLRRVATLARERRAPAAPAMREELPPHLTVRELEVIALVDRGLSNKEIAHALCIELPTVKNHVQRVLDKLGVRRRADAAAAVRRAGALEAVRRRRKMTCAFSADSREGLVGPARAGDRHRAAARAGRRGADRDGPGAADAVRSGGRPGARRDPRARRRGRGASAARGLPPARRAHRGRSRLRRVALRADPVPRAPGRAVTRGADRRHRAAGALPPWWSR